MKLLVMEIIYVQSSIDSWNIMTWRDQTGSFFFYDKKIRCKSIWSEETPQLDPSFLLLLSTKIYVEITDEKGTYQLN